MKTKLLVLLCAIKGYFYKWLVDLHIYNVPKLNIDEAANVIVSLTSYGRRIESNVLYYTLVSILRQSVSPKKIVVCVDHKKWNENNLPIKLRSLIAKGVEFMFCEDIRSYTKLIPVMKVYPNDYIITVDDDIIYDKKTIENLLEASSSSPDAVCCLNASRPIIKNGYPCEYEKWQSLYSAERGKYLIFPCGFGAVLYPPNQIDKKILFDSQRFLSLCPLADDVWFWFCEIMSNVTIIFVPKKHWDYSYDALYQFFHKGTALTHSNRYEHQNDKQIREIFNFYHVMMTNKGKLVMVDEKNE